MKYMKTAVVVVSFVSGLACAQTPAQSSSERAAQAQGSQGMQMDKHDARRDGRSYADPQSCVGPISFCRLYFGS
ncbi:hypothetical protein P3T18_004396 [Paraburkholderia sp. GAS199]|uniref:hypothetical protein n=1 Tax=Paraburkholderia sp. GAS199 TaxID=3035126 RepID=UPI003D195F9B